MVSERLAGWRRRQGPGWAAAAGAWALISSLALACRSPSAAEDLAISFSVNPPQVVSGSPFVARLVLANPTGQTVRLLGLYSCISFLAAFRDGRQVPLQGTEFDCPATFTQFTILPRDSLVASYVLAARIRDSASSTYLPAPPGTYRLRADLNFTAPDREVEFEVVPAASAPLPASAAPPAPSAAALSPRPAPAPIRRAAPSRTARTRPARRSS